MSRPLKFVFVPSDIQIVSNNPVPVAYHKAETSGGRKVIITYSHASGSIFPLGSTTIGITATSKDGQQVFAQFIIRVNPSPILNPVIDSLSPNSDVVGSSIGIIGSNFGLTQGTGIVTLNGVFAQVISWTSDSIIIEVPNTTTGLVVVTVNGIPSNGVLFTVETTPPPAIIDIINSSPLPIGNTGTQYSLQFQASGGTAPYAFEALDPLPDGMSLSFSGLYSGVPDTVQNVTFQIKATDSEGFFIEKSFSHSIEQSLPGPLQFSTASVPQATVGIFYSQSLEGIGGVPPYTWSLFSGSLPNGLSLVNNVIQGTPTVAGTFNFQIKLRDSVGTQVFRNFSIFTSAFGPNNYFNTYKNNPATVLAISFRNQVEIDNYVQSLPSSQWKYYSIKANDPHLIAPDGAKLFIPPRGWWRDRLSYPNGAFKYFNGNTAFVNQWGASGNEGSNNWANIKIPIGAGISAGWNDLTIVWDFWWDETFQTSRNAIGGDPDAWKTFFIYATGTKQLYHMHDVMGNANAMANGISVSHLGPLGEQTGRAAGVITVDPYQPTGAGAAPFNTYVSAKNKWTRYWIHFRFDVDGSQFTDWNAAYSVNVVGTFDMVSVWAASEIAPSPTRLIYKAPCKRLVTAPLLQEWRFAFDNSSSNLQKDEIQILDLGNIADGNSFTLTIPSFTNSRLGITTSQETTVPITLPTVSTNIASTIKSALESLIGIDIVKGNSGANPDKLLTGNQVYRLRFSGSPSGQTAISALTITPTGFTPSGITRFQVGGNPSIGMDNPMIAYMRNFLLFKNLGTPDESNTSFFASPLPEDGR